MIIAVVNKWPQPPFLMFFQELTIANWQSATPERLNKYKDLD